MLGLWGLGNLVETTLTYCILYSYGFSLGNPSKFIKLTYDLPPKLCCALYFPREATREIFCLPVPKANLFVCSHRYLKPLP